MPTKFTGGCTCRAIRYECTAEPIVMFNCHCRDCQRGSGGPYTGVVYVPAKAFKITKGTPRYYNTQSEAMGHNKRGFCPECGSRLFGGITDEGHGITASSLDDPTLFRPQFDIFTSDRSALGSHGSEAAKVREIRSGVTVKTAQASR